MSLIFENNFFERTCRQPAIRIYRNADFLLHIHSGHEV
jgi:hypothetical protein